MAVTLATAGHLVFSSMVNGDFFAVDDQTLETLWSVNLGSPIEAPPMTYAVNGKQYVVIPVGTAGSTTSSPAARLSWRPATIRTPRCWRTMQRTWTLYFFAL